MFYSGKEIEILEPKKESNDFLRELIDKKNENLKDFPGIKLEAINKIIEKNNKIDEEIEKLKKNILEKKSLVPNNDWINRKRKALQEINQKMGNELNQFESLYNKAISILKNDVQNHEYVERDWNQIITDIGSFIFPVPENMNNEH